MIYGNDVGFYHQIVIETEDNKKYIVRNYTFDYSAEDEMAEYEIMDEAIESIQELYKDLVKSINKGYIYFLNKEVKKIIYQHGVTTNYTDNLYNEYENLYYDYDCDKTSKSTEIIGKPYGDDEDVYLYKLTKEKVYDVKKEITITRYLFANDAKICAKVINIESLPNYDYGILTFDKNEDIDYSIYEYDGMSKNDINKLKEVISEEYDKISDMQLDEIINLAKEDLEDLKSYFKILGSVMGQNENLGIAMSILSIYKYGSQNGNFSEKEELYLKDVFGLDDITQFINENTMPVNSLITGLELFLALQEKVNMTLWFEPVYTLFRFTLIFIYCNKDQKDDIYNLIELLQLSPNYSNEESDSEEQNELYDCNDNIDEEDEYDEEDYDYEEDEYDEVDDFDDTIYNEAKWMLIESRGEKEFHSENQNVINDIVLTVKNIENVINNFKQLKDSEVMNAIMSAAKPKKRAEYYINLDYSSYFDSRIALLMKVYNKNYVSSLNSNAKEKADYIYNNYLAKHKSLLFLYAASQNMYEIDSIKLNKIYDSNNNPVEIARINPFESNMFIYKMDKKTLDDFIKLTSSIYAEAEYKNNSVIFTNDEKSLHKIIVVNKVGDYYKIVRDPLRNKLHFEMLGIHNPAPDLYYVLVEISVKRPNESRRIILDANEVTPIPVLKAVAKRFVNINDKLLEDILKPAFEAKGNNPSLFDNDKLDSKSLVYDDCVIPNTFPKDINEIISIFSNENKSKVNKYVNKIIKNVKKEINKDEFYNKAIIQDLTNVSKDTILKSIATFELLGDFNDSNTLKDRYYNYLNDLSKYEYAISIVESNPELALALLEDNPTFSNSENVINSIKSDIAKENKYLQYSNINLEFVEPNVLEQAINELGDISDYKKSKNLINKYQKELSNIKRYSEAIKLYNEFKYNDASKIFEQLGNYKNSKEMLEECSINLKTYKLYDKALRLIKNEDYNEALNILYKISYYKDSFDLINNIIDKVKEV
jgi:hypothetical protein